jgi:peptidoglycan/xylan/chitin deacetylase (PgdA/CDA1 family)
MQSRGFRGTNYIVGSRIGFENYLNWPELSVMVNNGWDIGTTGYSGANMSLLSNCQIEEDLDRDIDEISHKLCYKVTSMVAPYDIVTDGLIEVAKSRGIRAILSAKCYPNSIVKEKIDGFDYPLLGNALKETKTSNKWLIVAIGRLKYRCNAEGFNQILGMISSSGIRVATVDEVLDGTRNL